MISVVVIGRRMKGLRGSWRRFGRPRRRAAIRLPGTSRKCPSVTTVSPGSTPSLITI